MQSILSTMNACLLCTQPTLIFCKQVRNHYYYYYYIYIYSIIHKTYYVIIHYDAKILEANK
jgi:hypothetical protein